jgi:hypothetical protein
LCWLAPPEAQLQEFVALASCPPGDGIGTPIPSSEFWTGTRAPRTLTLLPRMPE